MRNTVLLRLYRIGLILLIAWMIREQHVRLRVQGDRPIVTDEVKPWLSEAATLKADASPRGGLWVLDASGQRIGYAARTAPHADGITGYSGPTDTLMVFGEDEKLLGISIRKSFDTPSHVKKVTDDIYWLLTWNGKTWEEIAGLRDLEAAGIYGVSGASRTSVCVAEGIAYRAAAGLKAAALPSPRWTWRDTGLAVMVLLAVALFFTPLRGRRKVNQAFYIFAFLYIGFVNGDLLAQSLFIGWMESGVTWRTTPGLALLTAAAFLLPWSTGKSAYCYRLCPHGHAQRWLGKVLPRRFHWTPGKDLNWALRWVPAWLIAVVLLGSIFALPLDAAGIEPFDAYLIRSAGVATVVVAIVGLVASLFIPMGYCKYGCPTGAMLDFVRSRGSADRFGARDAVAAGLTLLVFVACRYYETILNWIAG